MSITISIPDELEPALRQKAAAAGQDVEHFVRQIVAENLLEDPAVATEQPSRAGSHAEFRTRLRDLVLNHDIHHGQIDDSRESIYAGCGE
jgi:plasmid stability protein